MFNVVSLANSAIRVDTDASGSVGHMHLMSIQVNEHSCRNLSVIPCDTQVTWQMSESESKVQKKR